uniref:Uncharacterized protein n=1 Tax=Rhizophora mucronata TaxID=61149 RepID=A0A2P2PHJ7_RHIMU
MENLISNTFLWPSLLSLRFNFLS